MLKRVSFLVVTGGLIYLVADLKPFFGPVDTLAACAIGAVLMMLTRRWARR